jgi:hypothetical protein
VGAVHSNSSKEPNIKYTALRNMLNQLSRKDFDFSLFKTNTHVPLTKRVYKFKYKNISEMVFKNAVDEMINRKRKIKEQWGIERKNKMKELARLQEIQYGKKD